MPQAISLVYNSLMSKEFPTPLKPKQPRWYRGADVPMAAIRRFAREVAEKIRPDKVILFGFYANGEPHADSDVDILAIMPCRNEIELWRQTLALGQELPTMPLPLALKERASWASIWSRRMFRCAGGGSWFDMY